MNLDPSRIEERYAEAEERDKACTDRVRRELGRLVVLRPYQTSGVTSLDTMVNSISHAALRETGMGANMQHSLPEDGSYATQLWSSICFMVDARAELKLLQLIQSPDFYAALMRSAAEVKDNQS